MEFTRAISIFHNIFAHMLLNIRKYALREKVFSHVLSQKERKAESVCCNLVQLMIYEIFFAIKPHVYNGGTGMCFQRLGDILPAKG